MRGGRGGGSKKVKKVRTSKIALKKDPARGRYTKNSIDLKNSGKPNG